MINVNQITAQLARMPDQALQQYAQMHKGDPYTLSLALAESNRRKQMRQGAQMSVPEQPKVVDQAVQGMAAPMPEDVGIAQLPSGDMNYAEGGIVAFSDGGDVPRFRDEGLVQGYSHGMVDPSGLFGLGPEAMAYDQARIEEILARRKAAERAARIKYLETAAPETAQRMKQEDAAARSGSAPAAQTKPVAAPAPAADKGSRIPPAGGPGAAAPSASGPAAPATGITALQSPSQMYQNALEATPLVDPAAGQREALGKEMIGGAQRRLTERQAEIEKEGDLFKGRGERISKREEALGKDKEQMTGLAFLEAGLAVMSTPGGLATALGKGARVGTERFAAGLDKLRAAQERLEDAKDNLETLRLNRSDMNAKEIRAMKSDIDRAKLDAQKLGIDGLMQASDLRYKQAGEVFKVNAEQSLAVLREAGANQRQQMASAAAVKAAAMRPSTEDRTAANIVADYAKNPTKLKILEQTDPVMAQMIRAQIQMLSMPPVQNAPGTRP